MNRAPILFAIFRQKANPGKFECQKSVRSGNRNTPLSTLSSILWNGSRVAGIAVAGALLTAGLAHAQGTYTAASANESDVNAVINGPNHVAVNGDTIQIPCSGAQSVTWGATLTVNANITLTALGGSPNSDSSTFGAGNNCLTITAATSNLFQLNPTYSSSNNVITLQNMTLIPGGGAYTPINVNGTGTSSGMPLARIDNIQFGNGSGVWAYGTGSNTGEFAIIVNNAFGVADHNTLYTGSHIALISVNLTSYLGVGLYGDNSWAQPDSMGSANAFYVENNQTYQGLWPLLENEQTFPNIGGGRAVVRFNHSTMDGTFFLTGGHGLDTDGRPRSVRHVETYGNEMQCINGSVGNQCYDFAIFRGGTGMVFGNTGTVSGSGTNWKEVLGISTLRGAGDGWSITGFGSCGNATSGNAFGPFDQNDGVTYYSGTMGGGTGGTTIVDSSSPGWSSNQWSNPSDGYAYSVWDITQGWVSVATSSGPNSINVLQAPHGYLNGGTFISASAGDSYQIRRSKSCLDGAGRGAGALISGYPAVLDATGAKGSANQAIDPFYEWDNSAPAITGGVEVNTAYASRLQPNRDYFSDNALGSPKVQTSPTSPFNGQSGIGFGTLANRPTTCTPNSVSGAPGVGYFATDQGNWNSSSNDFGQGVLYACTATNTWTPYYTPYTYPHPLVSGNEVVGGTVPPPPTNLVSTIY